MSLPWDGAPRPMTPPLGAGARLRLGLRGVAAALWTGGAFALFLASRGLDRPLGRVTRGRARALAPGVVRGWARGALRLLGLRLRRVGAPMTRPGALVANHASWIDVVALQRAAGASFVAKAEVADWPAIGAIGRAIGTSFVARRAAEAGRQSAALGARLRRGDRICVFPEGTSTDGRRVLPFKSALFGAFFGEREASPDLWVQPVSLAYLAPSGLPEAFYAWWGDMDFAAHLGLVLALSRGGVVEVRFHPPLRAADFTSRKALAEAAGAAVREGHRAALVDLGAGRG